MNQQEQEDQQGTLGDGGNDLYAQTQPLPRSREKRRRLNVLSFLVRGGSRGVSGLALVLTGVAIVGVVLLVLMGLIMVVVQRSGDSISPGLTMASPEASKPGMSVITFTPVSTPPVPSTPASPAATPVQATTTPVVPTVVSVGGFVEVSGAGAVGIRLRTGPGLKYVTTKIVDEGTRFTVLEGPEKADDLQWWRLRSKEGTIGWAAGDYLKPVSSLEGGQ